MKRPLLAAAILACTAAPALARPHHFHHHHHRARVHAGGVGDPRPRAWCGWWMRHHKGVADRSFNLAINWLRYGRAAGGPVPGAIGVMRHHVFEVRQVLGNGMVLGVSGNDSHAVRTRPRSTRGVIGWRVG
jgi:hypothetical protein